MFLQLIVKRELKTNFLELGVKVLLLVGPKKLAMLMKMSLRFFSDVLRLELFPGYFPREGNFAGFENITTLHHFMIT